MIYTHEYFEANNLPNNAVLRLSWQELQCVLDYDKNVDDFFDISDEVENLFTKGGEA